MNDGEGRSSTDSSRGYGSVDAVVPKEETQKEKFERAKSNQEAFGFRKQEKGTRVTYNPQQQAKKIIKATSSPESPQSLPPSSFVDGRTSPHANAQKMFHAVLEMRREWAKSDILRIVIQWTKNYAKYCAAQQDGPCPRSVIEMEAMTSEAVAKWFRVAGYPEAAVVSIRNDDITGKKLIRDKSHDFRVSTCPWVRSMGGGIPHLKNFLARLPQGEAKMSAKERAQELAEKKKAGKQAYVHNLENGATNRAKAGDSTISDEDLMGLFDICRGTNKSHEVASKWGLDQGNVAGLGPTLAIAEARLPPMIFPIRPHAVCLTCGCHPGISPASQGQRQSKPGHRAALRVGQNP